MDLNRKLAYDILFQIESKNMYSNIAINNALAEKKNIKAAFIRELVYGTLEQKMYLEFVAGTLVKGRLKDIQRPARIIIKMALYQMIFMDGIEAYGAVNEAVELSKKVIKSRTNLINAALRAYDDNVESIDKKLKDIKSKDPIRYLSIIYSFEQYIVRWIIRDFGEERVEDILKALNRKPSIFIRTNLIKTNKNELEAILCEEGFEVENVCNSETALKVKGSFLMESDAYKKGLFSIQDKASQKLIDILDPKEGEYILDMCCAPGGKSFAAAERMNNSGSILSRDIYENKLNIMDLEKKRLGLENVTTQLWNAEELDYSLEGKFNKVICDVPCSGFGVISKKPEIKYKKAEEDIKKLPDKQLQILKNASKYLDKNGALIYSTCTINSEENHQVVKKFLDDEKGFVLEDEILFMPDKEDIDGFYIAKIKREGEL